MREHFGVPPEHVAQVEPQLVLSVRSTQAPVLQQYPAVQPAVDPFVQEFMHPDPTPVQPKLFAHVPLVDWQAPVLAAHPVKVVVCAGATVSLHDDGAQDVAQQFVEQMPLRHCDAPEQATPASRTHAFAPLLEPSQEYPAVSHSVSCDMFVTAWQVPGVDPLQVRQVPQNAAV